jgi:hypothetical protein
MDPTERGTWYPTPPPSLPGETDDAYTDRLTGADGTGREPYNHRRNRQCSIGYHTECSDPAGTTCKCPHHADTGPDTEPAHVVVDAADILAGLWYLPTTTAQWVMAGAYDIGVDLRPGEALAESLRRRIDTRYNTTISDGFLTDVVKIYADVRDNPGRNR